MIHLYGTYGTQTNNDTIKCVSHINTPYLCFPFSNPILAILILFTNLLYPTKPIADQ